MPSDVLGVDVHAHGAPRAFLDELVRRPIGDVAVERSDGRYVVTLPGERPLRPVAGSMLDFDRRGPWLDGQRMSRQLVSPWLDIHGQELSERDGQEWARQINNAMAEEVAQTSGRVLAYAVLHLADPKAAVVELERAVSELKMVGTMIPTTLPSGEQLTGLEYDDLWEAAQSLNVPIVLHPPTVAPSSVLFEKCKQSGVHGRAIETTIAATQIIMTGVFDRFPDLHLVLVHGGGWLPYQAPRLKGEAPLVNWDKTQSKSDGSTSLRLGADEYVKTFFYDSVLLSPPALRMLFDLVGTSHVMIGSDHGARPNQPTPPLLGSLDQVGLDAADRALVVHENAESLYALPEFA